MFLFLRGEQLSVKKNLESLQGDRNVVHGEKKGRRNASALPSHRRGTEGPRKNKKRTRARSADHLYAAMRKKGGKKERRMEEPAVYSTPLAVIEGKGKGGSGGKG